MIFKIVEEYPDYAYMTRFKAVEMQVLPDLVTKLTIMYCRDTVSVNWRKENSAVCIDKCSSPGRVFEWNVSWKLNVVSGTVC